MDSIKSLSKPLAFVTLLLTVAFTNGEIVLNETFDDCSGATLGSCPSPWVSDTVVSISDFGGVYNSSRIFLRFSQEASINFSLAEFESVRVSYDIGYTFSQFSDSCDVIIRTTIDPSGSTQSVTTDVVDTRLELFSSSFLSAWDNVDTMEITLASQVTGNGFCAYDNLVVEAVRSNLTSSPTGAPTTMPTVMSNTNRGAELGVFTTVVALFAAAFWSN